MWRQWFQLFMAEGDYENRNKARVRYIVEKLGEKETLAAYQKYVDQLREKGWFRVNRNHKFNNH